MDSVLPSLQKKKKRNKNKEKMKNKEMASRVRV
jgi:hypothetical protein